MGGAYFFTSMIFETYPFEGEFLNKVILVLYYYNDNQ